MFKNFNFKNSLKIKNWKLKIVGTLLFLLPIAYCLLPMKAAAFTMSNAFYIIILGNLNSIAGQASSGTNKITFTSGELGAGLYTGTNFRLCAGFYGGIFCNNPTAGLFTFTVSPTNIDFGTIDPTNPVIRTNILTVLSTGSGYSVTAIENHTLQTASGSAIPDTSCDSGLCSPTVASLWSSNLTYGLGYRCDNVAQTDCNGSFLTNYYRPFANKAQAVSPQVVMQNGALSPSEKQAQITYKVNVSGSQLPGVYTNAVTYVASPNF
jgi:hypothetical protein